MTGFIHCLSPFRFANIRYRSIDVPKAHKSTSHEPSPPLTIHDTRQTTWACVIDIHQQKHPVHRPHYRQRNTFFVAHLMESTFVSSTSSTTQLTTTPVHCLHFPHSVTLVHWAMDSASINNPLDVDHKEQTMTQNRTVGYLTICELPLGHSGPTDHSLVSAL